MTLAAALISAAVAMVVALLTASVTLWTARKSRTASLEQKLFESELRTVEDRQTRLQCLASEVQTLRATTQSLVDSLDAFTRNHGANATRTEVLKTLEALKSAKVSFDVEWSKVRADFVVSFGAQAELQMRVLRHELRGDIASVESKSNELLRAIFGSDRSVTPEQQSWCNVCTKDLSRRLRELLQRQDNYYYTVTAYLSVFARQGAMPLETVSSPRMFQPYEIALQLPYPQIPNA